MLAENENTEDPSVGQILADMDVSPIDGRLGQLLRIHLEDKLYASGYHPVDSPYRLQISLSSNTMPVAISRDGTVSRYNAIFNAHVQIIRNNDNIVLMNEYVKHSSSYNNQPNTFFSAYVSEQDALHNGMESLAENIRLRVANYVVQHSQELLQGI